MTYSIVPFGGPKGTVPEPLFEKKDLIPDIQQLSISCQLCYRNGYAVTETGTFLILKPEFTNL